MFSRPLRAEDLMECLEIAPELMGTELVGRAAAIAEWENLIDAESFDGLVVEADPPLHGYRIVGFGCSALVTAAFADGELAHPQPGLNARIIQSLVRGPSAVLTSAQLRAANTSGGIDVVSMYLNWRAGVLSREQIAEVGALGAAGFLENHAGYRLRSMIAETVGPEARALVMATRVYRLVRDFAESPLPAEIEFAEPDRALWKVSPDAISIEPDSFASILFQFREPVLGLRDAERRLLTAALRGLTDPDLAGELHLSMAAIKKLWQAIFERISEVMPDLLREARPRADGLFRGSQKRPRILAYIRSHPEELRPFDTRRGR